MKGCENLSTAYLHRPHKERRGPGHKKGTPAWNKGLTKEDPRVAKNTMGMLATMRAQLEAGTRTIPPMGIEARKKLSLSQSLRNRGGKCKWYKVNGVSVQGTWERDIAIILTDKGILWEKPSVNAHVWTYVMDGKERSYSPDFYLPQTNIWLEVKGHWWGRDKEKLQIVMEKYPERKLIVIQKEEYRRILRGELVW